jgi:peroxiredoxin
MNSNYKLSEKAVCFFAVLISFLTLSLQGFAGEIQIGSEIPDKQVNLTYAYETREASLYEFKNERVLLIAFIPSVSPRNEYASIMASAFDAYFAEGLSFGENINKAYDELSIAVVSYDGPDDLAEYGWNMNFNFPMISDKDKSLSEVFGVEEFKSDNASAKVFIVGKDNKIKYAEQYYRGEGEKLKTVKKELFTLLGVEVPELTENRYAPLMTGDDARDFAFKYVNMGKDGEVAVSNYSEGSLSELKGKNILLGFYPAPFSFSCSGEIISYDEMMVEAVEPENNSAGTESFKDLEVLMVSSENTGILKKWMTSMNFENIKFLSDDNAEIAAKYNSFFFDRGYNRRTIFLINKEGKVAYIDWDYQVNDEDLALLKDEIRKLN